MESGNEHPLTPATPTEPFAAPIYNAENLAVADGTTALRLDEDNVVLDLSGDTAVSGEGSTGAEILGDGASVTLGGDTTVSEGGTAVRITGDDADIQASDIDATATGAGSSLVSITGDDANANLSGTLTVRDGARGLDISGDRATVQSAARIDVADAGSIGIRVAADNPAEGDFTRFTTTGDILVSKNATGASIAGSRADVTLGGDIAVTVARNDEGVLQGGQGVVVEGDHGTVRINGNVTVANEDIGTYVAQLDASAVTRGVSVSGSDNHVSVDGAIDIAAIGTVNGPKQARQWTGLRQQHRQYRWRRQGAAPERAHRIFFCQPDRHRRERQERRDGEWPIQYPQRVGGKRGHQVRHGSGRRDVADD